MSVIRSLIVKLSLDSKGVEDGTLRSKLAFGALTGAATGAGIAVARTALGFGTMTAAAGAARGALFGMAGGVGAAAIGVSGLGSQILNTGRALGGIIRDLANGTLSFRNLGGALAGVASGFGLAVGKALLFRAAVMAGAVAAVGLTASLAAASGSAIKAAANFEQLEVSFTTMLRSGAKARALLADISDFAAETPFEFGELSSASRSLVAFGTPQRDLVDTLRALGDVSAAVSQPLGEIAEIYGKARVQGRLFAEDVNQFTGRGIPIIQELAKQFGVADSQVKELVKNGQVEFRHLERAFQSLTSEGGRFEGMMAKQSQTVIGLSSTLKDNLGITLRATGQLLTEGLGVKDAIKGMVEYTDSVRMAVEALRDLQQFTGLGRGQGGVTPGLLLRGLTSGGIGGINHFFRGRDYLIDQAFGGTKAEQAARGQGLESARQSAIEGEARRWREGFTSRRATNELVRGLFFESLPAVNKEAAADKRSFASNRQTTEMLKKAFLDSLGEVKPTKRSGLSNLQTFDLFRGAFFDSFGEKPKKQKDEPERGSNSFAVRGSQDAFTAEMRNMLKVQPQDKVVKATEKQTSDLIKITKEENQRLLDALPKISATPAAVVFDPVVSI